MAENAIVDFKYSASPKVTWWFDHHQSAFLTPDDQRDFLAWQAQANGAGVKVQGGKFYDPDYVSCTSLIADVARERYGFDTAPLAELIRWADIVDGARYESAEAAVGMAAPAMKLTMVIESSGEGFVPRIIPLLTEMTLQQVLDQPFVQAELGPLMERHLAGIELCANAPRSTAASSPSTSPTASPRATTNSSRTTCIPRRPTTWASAAPTSAPRSPSAPTRGLRCLWPTSPTWPPSASATAAAATPASAPSASPLTRKTPPAKPPKRSPPS